MAAPSESLVVFTLADRRFALRIAVVERIERAVEIVPLAEATRGVAGIIILRGKVVPVFDLREHFGLPGGALRASDQFVIVKAHGRLVAIIVEDVVGVVDASALTTAEAILPGLDSVEGVVALEGGLALLHDLEKILSFEVVFAFSAEA